MVETSSGGGCSARCASSALSAGLLERVGGAHLAVGGLQQRHQLVVRLVLGADLAVGDDGVDRAVLERGVRRDGAGLSICWASIVTSTARPASAAACTTARSVSVC